MPGDERPAVWVGHVALPVSDVKRSAEFMAKLGMRELEVGHVGIFELRGGTHLILFPTDQPVAGGAVAPFDLMVDDLEAAHASFRARGLEPSEIRDVEFHRCFTLVEPGGHEITVNSTHVSDLPV